MSSKKQKLSAVEENILEGVQQMVGFFQGNTEGFKEIKVSTSKDEVNRVRKKMDMTQEEFCENFGLNLSTFKKWSMGARKPNRTARILFDLIDQYPEQVKSVLDKGNNK